MSRRIKSSVQGPPGQSKLEMCSKTLAPPLPLLLLLWALAAATAQETTYTTKYDNIDVDNIIRNERLLNNYVGCLLDKNACTPEGSELKKNLPDALATQCASCSEAQKRISEKLTHFLIDNRPNDWALLEQRYDPSGAFRQQYLNLPKP